MRIPEIAALACVFVLGTGCGGCGAAADRPSSRGAAAGSATAAHPPSEGVTLLGPAPAGMEIATFAGGCFWCTESSFEHVRGVTDVISGYSGGPESEPTYEQVGGGDTGHTECVRVVYDPNVVTYEQLLAVFWRVHDPTTRDRSFFDEGRQYRSAIYTHSPAQRAAADASKRALETAQVFPDPIVTEIADAGPFWRAEEYHQNYWRTHPAHYQSYRDGSGRDAFSARIWGQGALEAAERHDGTGNLGPVARAAR